MTRRLQISEKEMECVEDAKQAFLIAHESLHSNLQSASLSALCETQHKEQQCISTLLHWFGLARSFLPKLSKQVVKAMFNEDRGTPQPTELDIKNATRQVDSVGRSRWKTPRSGNLFFFLRKESNPLTDAWDIAKCLKGPKKPVGVVVVDNCVSDGLGPSGHVAFLCLGMMWLHAELDVLIVTSYAPNRSFQNMVELLFGWVSQRLAGNVISEDPNAAMLDIRNLVDGMRDGYSVLCDIPPDGPPADWPSYDTLPPFTRSSNKQIRSDESLREVYERFLFFLDHCDRRTNLLAFIRCSKKNCPGAKKPWRAKRFRAELDHLKGLPTPIPHPAHADHFLSYAELNLKHPKHRSG